MRDGCRYSLFRVALAGLAVRGSGWVLLVGALLFAWLAPLVTPWEESPRILQPARAQAAWLYAWLVLFTWLPFQASAFGHRLRREGFLECLHANGLSRAGLCLQITAAVAVWLLGVVLLAAGVCVVFCLPQQAEEARLWLSLVGQYVALFVIVGLPLTLLAVALGTCAAEVLAFLVPVALLFVGLFGAVWLGPLLGGSSGWLHRALWLAVPHYHLADLTPRLVFKMGPLPITDFLTTLAALGVQGLAISILGLCVFRTRS